MSENPWYVLDTYALVAFLKKEPASERVYRLFKAAGQHQVRLAMSLINYGEVCYIMERAWDYLQVQFLLGGLELTPLQIFEATRDRVFKAAHLKANHRISYADAFAVALAQELQATLVTGDPEFHAVERLIKIEWLTG